MLRDCRRWKCKACHSGVITLEMVRQEVVKPVTPVVVNSGHQMCPDPNIVLPALIG